jgi:hypothetical protein
MQVQAGVCRFWVKVVDLFVKVLDCLHTGAQNRGSQSTFLRSRVTELCFKSAEWEL